MRFSISHLRTCRNQLMRNIREEDLKDSNGEYFQAANDVAMYLPILEQAHLKVVYLPEVTYLYNDRTGSNNH